jgi:hypothetical protein
MRRAERVACLRPRRCPKAWAAAGVARIRRSSRYCRLERVAGSGIIAPRRSSSAHLHRPWRATLHQSATSHPATSRCGAIVRGAVPTTACRGAAWRPAAVPDCAISGLPGIRSTIAGISGGHPIYAIVLRAAFAPSVRASRRARSLPRDRQLRRYRTPARRFRVPWPMGSGICPSTLTAQ